MSITKLDVLGLYSLLTGAALTIVGVLLVSLVGALLVAGAFLLLAGFGALWLAAKPEANETAGDVA